MIRQDSNYNEWENTITFGENISDVDRIYEHNILLKFTMIINQQKVLMNFL